MVNIRLTGCLFSENSSIGNKGVQALAESLKYNTTLTALNISRMSALYIHPLYLYDEIEPTTGVFTYGC